MTREEAIEELSNCETEYGFHPNDVCAVVNKVYDDFEQQLKALQSHKSCDGCRYDSERRYGCYRWDDCIREHTRKERIDRYEPKDKQ